MYDIAVIGKGLMGCGAIRHLTVAHPDLKVCIIGPDEPENFKTHQGVFASHYDQGRITRILDTSILWGTLAKHSIDQYAIIEQESGIQFHHAVGCLRATDMDDKRDQVMTVARHFGLADQPISAEECAGRHPYFKFSNTFYAWDEKGDAGYINPRSLVQAQLKCAEQNGATIIRETVAGLDTHTDGVTIQTEDGNTITAQKALITAGGFTNLILKEKLRVKTRAHMILLAEIPQSEVERLATMPSLITTFENRDVPSLYMLPPVPYPDGKTYIKLGSEHLLLENNAPEKYLDITQNRAEVTEWFHSDGRDDVAGILKPALYRLIPNLKVTSYITRPCLITDTDHGNPYIDELIADKVYVTTGGNGSSAKSSDEIGRIGAMLTASGQWQSELNRADFKVVMM